MTLLVPKGDGVAENFDKMCRRVDDELRSAAGRVDAVMKYAVQTAFLTGVPGTRLAARLVMVWSHDQSTKWSIVESGAADIVADLPLDHWFREVLLGCRDVGIAYASRQHEHPDRRVEKAAALRGHAAHFLAMVPQHNTSMTRVFCKNYGGRLRIGTVIRSMKTFVNVRFEDTQEGASIATDERAPKTCERGWVEATILARPAWEATP